MKVVMLTADGLEHRYVYKLLKETLGSNLHGVAVERKVNQKFSLLTLKRLKKRYSFLTIVERVITKTIRKLLSIDKRKRKALSSILGDLPSILEPNNDVSVFLASSVNSNECIDWVNNINPDLILVYGTGIVGKDMLTTPSLVLNLHTGMSPYYRGSSCDFWALYNSEAHMVGSTIHQCTRDVDGGDIYNRTQTKLVGDDTVFTAFAKNVKTGSKSYANVASQICNGKKIAAEGQDFSMGKEYRFVDKTFVQELRMEYLTQTGLLKSIINNSLSIKPPCFKKNNEDC
jgi:methionyl-tRNA formyltransferase